MKLPGFIGPTYASRVVNYECQRTINLFPEFDENGSTGKEHEVAMLLSVPGQLLVDKILKTPIRALHLTAFGHIICVAGNTVYYLNSPDQGVTWDTPTPIADLTTSTGIVSIADGIPNFYKGQLNTAQIGVVCVVDASNYGVIFDEDTRIAQQLNTGSSYNGASFVTFQDGFFIFTQNIKSASCFFANDPYNISDLDVVVANLGPDYISRIICDHDVVWFFGGRSSSVWQNTGGGTGSNIFQQIPGSYAEGGCNYPQTIQKVSGQMLWVTSDERGFGMVFQAAGYRGTRASNHSVEKWIADNKESLAGATTWTYQDQGHSFYLLNIPGATTTWAYDLTTKMWSERANFKNGVFSRDPVENRVTLYGDYLPMHLVSDATTGNLYTLSNDEYTINGEPIYRMRTAPHSSSGLKRVFYSQVQIDLETGVGLDGAGYPYITGVDENDPSTVTVTDQPLAGSGPIYYFVDSHGENVTPDPTPTVSASGTWSNDYTWVGGNHITVNATDFTIPSTDFGTGTDAAQNFTFVAGGLASGTTITTANIYEEDWRGNVLQSTLPTTNLCTDSRNFSASSWLTAGSTSLPAVWNAYPTVAANHYRPTAYSTISSSGTGSVTNSGYAYDSTYDTIKTSGTYAAFQSAPTGTSFYGKYTNWGSGVALTGKLVLSLYTKTPTGGGGSIQYSIDAGVTWLPLWYFNIPSIFPPSLVGYGKDMAKEVPIIATLTIPDMSQFQIEVALLSGDSAAEVVNVYDMIFMATSSSTDSTVLVDAPDGTNTGTYLKESFTYGPHAIGTSYGSNIGTSTTVSVYYQIGDSSRSIELALQNPQLSFTGSIATDQLTVSVPPTDGVLAIGQTIEGAGIPPGTTITAGTSSPYTLSWTATQPLASANMLAYSFIAKGHFSPLGVATATIGTTNIEPVGTVLLASITGDQLFVTTQYSGKLVVGQILQSHNLPSGTSIVSGTSSPYTIDYTAPTTLPNEVITVVTGGLPTGIYRCSINGTETQTGISHAGIYMYDANSGSKDWYFGNGSSKVGIWGFQVQTGSLTQYVASASGVSGVDFITLSNTTGTVTFNIPPATGSRLSWDGVVHGTSISPVTYLGSYSYTSYPYTYEYLGLDPQMSLSYSDDGGHTWSPERSVSIGRTGNYLRRALWRRLGQSRDRVFRVTCVEPVRFNIIGAEFKATEGEANQ